MASEEATVVTLDPYTCLARRNRKYASECTEVYLAKLGAEAISKNFEHFANLEVVWFSGNRLSRIENLETNFRIREVYVEDNRLVSLSGLRSFKFLRVLLASNNQLWNLDKQLALLSRFAFLKKLDLFGNPVAEEPDYRLRLIYHVPQVEILDRHSVKETERLKAAEVVPNLDKVSAAKVERSPRNRQQLSEMERTCIQTARRVRERRRAEEANALSATFYKGVDPSVPPPEARIVRAHRDFWSDSRNRVLQELLKPSPWERVEMLALIQKKAGKPQLNKEDVEGLVEVLAKEGVEEVGRVLSDASALQQASGPNQPLEKLFQDPPSSIPVADVAKWLLSLEWPRSPDEELQRRIDKLYESARRAETSGDAETLAKCRNMALRLEGAITLKQDVGLSRKEGPKSTLKLRNDFFPQMLLEPKKELDSATGRMGMKVSLQRRSTSIGVCCVP